MPVLPALCRSATIAVGAAALLATPARPVAADSGPVQTALTGVAVVRTADAVGTAFAVSDGRLLTAAHVVGSASTVQVTIGGRSAAARVMRASPAMDLALLKTETLRPTPLRLRSGPPQLGEPVYAVGAALGDLSVTRGIVSGRRLAAGFSHVQTDAAINPGNSGGPLLGDDGKVIGLVVSKMRDAEGIALAVSAADLTAFLQDQQSAAVAPSAPSVNSRRAGTNPGGWGRWWPLLLPVAGLAFLARSRPRRLGVRVGPVRDAAPAGQPPHPDAEHRP